MALVAMSSSHGRSPGTGTAQAIGLVPWKRSLPPCSRTKLSELQKATPTCPALAASMA